jgi:threonine synthase
MCRNGFFIEPTAAATTAGVRQYMEHHAKEDEIVVSVLSGSGLKAADKVAQIVRDENSSD